MPVSKQNEPGFHHHMDMPHFAKRVIWTLVGILLAYMIVFFGTLIRNNMQKFYFIGKADRQERIMTLEGQGKVTAMPDIALTTLGMIAEAKTVAEAQGKNTAVMNKLNEKLTALGVAAADIRTVNYAIYPQYNYTEENGQQLVGYQVSQQVTVKIRDLAKAGAILALAGEVGANNVSGLSFAIDNPDAYKAQARQIALDKVAVKARALARSLGVQFGDVVSYNEYDGGDVPMYKTMSAEAAPAPASAPDISPGSSDVLMNVQVTFEIR